MGNDLNVPSRLSLVARRLWMKNRGFFDLLNGYAVLWPSSIPERDRFFPTKDLLRPLQGAGFVRG
jgi:hypothetical protein